MKKYQILKLKKSFTLAFWLVFVASLGIPSLAFAKEEWANLYGNTGRCDICHTGTVGTKNNTKSAAKTAYKSGGLTPGLKNYVATILESSTPTTPNTKPILNSVNAQWDVIAGESIVIPLVVNDAEEDEFSIVNKVKVPAGANLTNSGIDSASQLPKWEFNWSPSSAQQNKIYTVKFAAKETSTAKKYTSNTIAAKIRVWPAGDQDNAKVSSFTLASASWKADALTLKGKVGLNKLLTASEKASFLAREDLTVDIYQGKTSTGAAVALQLPIKINRNGSWSLTQPLAGNFACNVSLLFEGRTVSRKIAKAPSGCIR